MKTYMCDMCGDFVNDPTKRVYMREIYFKQYIKKKKDKYKKIHLCDNCMNQIIELSDKKRRGKNDQI